jgi:hypothetical protein
MKILFNLILLFIVTNSYAFDAFFDNDKRTLFAPQEPEITDFDLDILELCGNWGAEVKAVDFEKMMLAGSNKKVLKNIKKSLGKRIFSKFKSDKQFVHDLRRVWFEQKGFQHVFCGEPNSYDLGGFHYALRYWQAQDKGWAGYRQLAKNYKKRPIAKCQKFYLKEKINPPIFTTSVSYKDPESGKNRVKCVSGYHRLMNAQRILIAGTKAFKQANKKVGKNSKEACLYRTQMNKVPEHFSTLVIKQRALRTFFPIADKRPYCKKNKKDYKACLCSNL